MMKDKKIGWMVKEVVGVSLINPILLLPEEERKRILDEKAARLKRLREEGQPAANPPHVCPNGCEGPFRTHGTHHTLVGYPPGAPDGNHWTEECSCEACGSRFTKEWVPAKNEGRPWFVVRESGKRRVYSGECQCCCPKP